MGERQSPAEAARIRREATETVASLPPTATSDARQEALRRYLGAQRYHEERIEEAEDLASPTEEGS